MQNFVFKEKKLSLTTSHQLVEALYW